MDSATDTTSNDLEGLSLGEFGKGAKLIVIGLAVCVFPYFVSIGTPIWVTGVVRLFRTDEPMRNKAIVSGAFADIDKASAITRDPAALRHLEAARQQIGQRRRK